MISFISAGAGTCKQVSADSVMALSHALQVMHWKNNVRRHIKVTFQQLPQRCILTASLSPRPAVQRWLQWPGVNECEVAV